MECKLTDIVQLKTNDGTLCNSWLIMGEVVGVHIHSKTLLDRVYKTLSANPIMRGGGAGDYYNLQPDDLFELLRPN